MKLYKFYLEDEQHAKLLEIGMEMERQGIDIRDKRSSGMISRAAVVRELVNRFDLPAKTKNTPIDMPISSKRIRAKLKPGQPGEATPVKDSDVK